MSILKLPNAGDTAILDITGCEYVEGEYGPQVKFVAGDDILFLPQTAADRQLDRIGLLDGNQEPEDAYKRVVGERLIFYRAPNPRKGGKPFWDISTVNGKPPVAKSGAEQAPSQSAPGSATVASAIAPTTAPAAESEKPKLMQVYLDATEFILNRIVPLYVAKDIGVSDTACAAMVATLVIQAGKER